MIAHTFQTDGFLVTESFSVFGWHLVVDLDGAIVADASGPSLASAEAQANAQTFEACGREAFS